MNALGIGSLWSMVCCILLLVGFWMDVVCILAKKLYLEEG